MLQKLVWVDFLSRHWPWLEPWLAMVPNMQMKYKINLYISVGSLPLLQVLDLHWSGVHCVCQTSSTVPKVLCMSRYTTKENMYCTFPTMFIENEQ